MRRNSIQLSRRHEWFAYGVSAASFGTGAAWAWLHYLVDAPNEFGAPSLAEIWLLKIHGAAAMGICVLLGTLLPLHINFAWRAGRNLRTGLSLLGLLLFLSGTGYGLYYVGGDTLRTWTSQAHLWTGLLFVPLLLIHGWRGRKSRPRGKP